MNYNDYCLVCAAKGHLVEYIYPHMCKVNGGGQKVCMHCNAPVAWVPLEVATKVRGIFYDFTGQISVHKALTQETP